MGGIDAYTVLMLHMDGADTSTTFTDSSYAGANSPHTVTANGNAQIDTAQSVFGGASAYLDGVGDFLSSGDSADWVLPSTFTLEARVRWDTALPASYAALIGQYVDSSNYWTWYTQTSGSTVRMRFLNRVLGSNTVGILNSAYFEAAANTWYHLVIVRSGNTFYWFVDGTNISTSTDADACSDFAASLSIGDLGDEDVGILDLKAWLDEVRISNIARWTSNFTPPTRAYNYFGGRFLGLNNAEGTEQVASIMGVPIANVRKVMGV